MSVKKICLLLITFALPYMSYSQTAYFIDGYHGGVYGHYPDWQTQFMVDMLNKYPDWKINLEIEPETWDTVKVNQPEAYNNFKAALTNPSTKDRIEFINASYAQSYFYNISGESIIKHFTYGLKKTKEHFPSATFTTYSSEEPCFTSALPQILKSLGFEYAVLKNPNTGWGGYIKAHGGELVNWLGPDGTKIITVPRYASEGLEPGSTWQTEAWDNSEEYINGALKQGIKNPVGMTLQDAAWDGGPWLENTVKEYYRPSEYKTWTNYIKNFSIGSTDKVWDFSQEDILVSLMWGSQVLQTIAQQVRTSENNIVAAEKLASFASVYDETAWPEPKIDEAWRTLMLSQHHDTWIVPYNGPPSNTWADKVRRWTNNTNELSNNIIQQSISDGSQNGENADSFSLRVYNTIGSSRTDVVEHKLPTNWKSGDATVRNQQGEKIPSQLIDLESDSTTLVFTANVPGMGYNTYQIQKSYESSATPGEPAGATASRQEDGTVLLESDLYKIVIEPDNGGTIKSLKAKNMNNREFVDQTHEKAFNEIRGHFFEKGRFYSNTEQPAKVEISENGPVRAKVKINGNIAGHPYTQEIGLVQGQRRIDFNLNLDWQGNPKIGEFSHAGNYEAEDRRKAFYNDKYKVHVLFPSNLDSQILYKNAPFDVTKSSLDDTFFGHWDEIKHNIILNWVDVTNSQNEYGLALLSDHTTSYLHGEDYPLGLTLQYSGLGLWGRNYRITGPTNVEYSIVPHKGMWNEAGIWSEDSQWNEPLIPTSIASSSNQNKPKTSLIDLSDTGFELVTMLTEEDGLKVRLFNSEGNETRRELTFNAEFSNAEIIELSGEVSKKLKIQKNQRSTTVYVTIPKFGIQTLRLSN